MRRKMSALNSRSVSRKRKRNENPESPLLKLISQAKSRSANVQCVAEKFLKPTRATFASIRRLIVSRARSSCAKKGCRCPSSPGALLHTGVGYSLLFDSSRHPSGISCDQASSRESRPAYSQERLQPNDLLCD